MTLFFKKRNYFIANGAKQKVIHCRSLIYSTNIYWGHLLHTCSVPGTEDTAMNEADMAQPSETGWNKTMKLIKITSCLW